MICIKKSFHGVIPAGIFVIIIVLLAFDIDSFLNKNYILFIIISIALVVLFLLFLYQFINFLYDLNIRKHGYEIKGIVIEVYYDNSGKVDKHFVYYKYKLGNKWMITMENLENRVGNNSKRKYFKKNERIPLVTNGKKALINYKKLQKK